MGWLHLTLITIYITGDRFARKRALGFSLIYRGLCGAARAGACKPWSRGAEALEYDHDAPSAASLNRLSFVQCLLI